MLCHLRIGFKCIGGAFFLILSEKFDAWAYISGLGGRRQKPIGALNSAWKDEDIESNLNILTPSVAKWWTFENRMVGGIW